MLGIGAMLYQLSGGSDEPADKYYGRKVTNATIDDEMLLLAFEDGTKIKIWDNGQSCCESRYITCDDDVSVLIGGELIKIEAKEGGERDEKYECHEWCFVDVQTSAGFITMTTHNEHNGYYGGFGLSITEIPR